MDTLELVLLLAATVTSGLLAGAFLLYAHTVMPALHSADDSAFVDMFGRLDRAIVNPLFMVTGFLGAPVLTVLAAVFADGGTRWWIVGALVLHALMIAVTSAVNVPLNDALKAAPHDADPSAVRAAFGERRWRRWNLLRVVLSIAATALLAYALTT